MVIVDDNDQFSHALKLLLDRDDAVAVVAVVSCGQEGIDLAQQSDADVVLMDALMPEMTGFEAMQQIHRAQSRRLVIVLSAHSAEEMGAQAFAAGADGFLTKSRIENHISAKIKEVVATNHEATTARGDGSRVICHLCAETLLRPADYATLRQPGRDDAITICIDETRCDARMSFDPARGHSLKAQQAGGPDMRLRHSLRHLHCTEVSIKPQLVGQ